MPDGTTVPGPTGAGAPVPPAKPVPPAGAAPTPAPAKASKYEELVTIIMGIEQSSPHPESGSVDISTMFSEDAEGRPATYAELVKVIDDVEGSKHTIRPAHQQKEEAHAPQPEVQSQARPAAAPRAAVQIPRQVQPTAQQPHATQPQVQRTAAPQPSAGESRRAAAAAELESVAKKLGSLMPTVSPMGRRRIDTRDLVLPNLSTSDQIPELERIIDGLKQGVFDPQHLGIVMQEVYGLAQAVNDERKASKGKKVQMTELDSSLLAIRDQRLAEAVALLSKSGG